MEAYYSAVVKLKIQEGKEKDLIDVLNKKIEDDTNGSSDRRPINYNIEQFYPDYNAPYNLEQLCDIFFVKHQDMYNCTRKGDSIDINSNFDVGYGRLLRTIDAFKLIAPFLTDESEMFIESDGSVHRVMIKGGKAIFVAMIMCTEIKGRKERYKKNEEIFSKRCY